MSFVHLHNHSYYSLLDGLAPPASIIKKAKEQGSPAVAITDHGVMYGAIEFYKAAKSEDMKPVIGCEVYVAVRGRKDKETGIDNKRFHLILLAETQEGYENLLELTTKAHLEGMYYKPRVDFELLEEFNKGIIASSACLQGHIPNALLNGNEEKAREYIEKFQTIYGKENFFLEVQDHPHLPDQEKANNMIIDLAKDLKIPLIATNDAHYLNKEDDVAHDVMVCMQTNSQIDDQNRMSMMGEDFSMRDPKDMIESFSDIPEIAENTLSIAERCNVNLKFGEYLIPAFDIPDKKKANEYLREVCIKNCKELYEIRASEKDLYDNKLDSLNDEEKEVIERLNFELDVIHQMGFNKYFLIVWDFVHYAKSKGIMVGPGRGSAAGSVVAYVLRITDLDPIKHQLLFERFLNPERVSMPDIDIDFADNRRDEVIDYVVEKYGQDHVAQISTFGTMAARAAVKDVGRVMGVPFAEMNNLAKLIPERPGTKLQEALDSEQELQKAYKSTDLYKKIIDIALKLEGTVRHVSVHACAVVISPEPLVKYSALQHPPKDDTSIISQYSAKPLEALGLLKMDFLGLKNLTIIQRTINIIKRMTGEKINIDDIPMDDKEAYELFARGETTGIFQFESPGMRRYLKQLKPTEFEDIIAMVALYRPGPMDWIPDYMKGKHGQKKVHYIHPSLEPFLKNTYGIAIYQEQILEIAKFFAGFSLGEADILRRAIGKKIMSELMSQKEKFIEGSLAKGHDKETAINIFEKVIEPFAGYGFNKSHAAGYSLIAYQTAYLKAHYPTEFMAALMSCDADNTDKIVIEIEECRNMGIEVLPPDVNESFTRFTVVASKKIRFGLSAIKGVGDGPIQSILDARGTDEIKFNGLEDFVKRIDPKVLNKKTLESLAKSGAMDSLGERNQILQNFEDIVAFAKESGDKKSNGQTDLFGMLGDESQSGLRLQEVTEASFFQKLAWEKELLGMYITSHPLAGLKTYIRNKVNSIGHIKKDLQNKGKTKTIGGLVTQRRKIRTKKGDDMMILEITGATGKMQATFFPNTYKNYIRECETDQFLNVSGKIEIRNGEYQIIAHEAKISSLEVMRENAKEQNVFDEEDTGFEMYVKEREIEEEASSVEASATHEAAYRIHVPKEANKEHLMKLKELLISAPGNTPIELYIEKENNIISLPIKGAVNDELKSKIEALWKTPVLS